MLVHHFSSKAALDRTVVEAIEARMRANAWHLLSQSDGRLDADAVVQRFSKPEQLANGTLFGTVQTRALTSDAAAHAIMRLKREALARNACRLLGERASAERMSALVLGAPLDAIFADMTGEDQLIPGSTDTQ